MPNDKLTSDEFKQMLANGELNIVNGKLQSKTKRNKFGSNPKVYKDITYQSAKEANAAATLDLLISAGEVIKWERQVPYKFWIETTLIFTYYLDFKVYMSDGTIKYIDVKGIDSKTGESATSTELFKIKKKIIEEIYGIKIDIQ
jgi:hypothetical protein